MVRGGYHHKCGTSGQNGTAIGTIDGIKVRYYTTHSPAHEECLWYQFLLFHFGSNNFNLFRFLWNPLFCHLFTSDLHGVSFCNVFPRWLLHRLLLFFCFGSHELDFYCHYRRSLRISTPLSDSACSSSAESSDCESSTSHIQVAGAPVEILPGLFLGNATHSKDARALQKYNIQVSN